MGKVKGWHLLKQEYCLNNNTYLLWLQLINSIAEKWKFTIKQTGSDAKNLIIHDHHLKKRFKKANSRNINMKGTISNTNFK